MTQNPITALSDLFNKLITEHGSAVIQEKHIALLREQLTILDKKLTMLDSENKVLKSENETLKAENQTLNIENEKLKQKIQEYEQPHTILLDPTELEILKLLFARDRLTTEQVAQTLKIQTQKAKFHLEELLKYRLVHIASSIGKGVSWYLSQEGRRYVIENKLVS